MTVSHLHVPAFAVAGLLLAGCCSSRVSDEGGRLVCDADNSCFLVVNALPIASGDPDYPNECECVNFTDTTTLSNNLKIIRREMTRHGATGLRNIVSFRTEEQVFFFLLKRSTLHTSAELVRNPKQ